ARCPLALELDPLAVADPGGDARLDGARAHRPPAAGAGRARVVDDQAAAAAGLARLGEREVPQVAAALPGTFAGRADPRHRAGLGAGAHSLLARALAGQPQRDGGAVDGVAEVQRRLGLDVSAAPRPGLLLGAPSRTEDPAENVAQPAAGAAATTAAEQVVKVEPVPAAGVAAGAGHPDPPAAEHRARLVVLLAPLLIGQDVVGLGDLLEALLGLRVALVGVRVILAGQLAVRLLDLVRGRTLGHAEGLVVVLLEEVLGAQRASLRRFWSASGRAGAVRTLCVLRLAVGRPVVWRGSGAISWLRHRHPGGPHDAVAHLVAGLQDLHAGRLGDL